MSQPNFSNPNQLIYRNNNTYENNDRNSSNNSANNNYKPKYWFKMPPKYQENTNVPSFEVKLLYPSSIIGYIIGNKGESIKELKNRFDCDIKFIGNDVKQNNNANKVVNGYNNNNNKALLSDRPLKIEVRNSDGETAKNKILDAIKAITLKENTKKRISIGRQTYDETLNLFKKYSLNNQNDPESYLNTLYYNYNKQESRFTRKELKLHMFGPKGGRQKGVGGMNEICEVKMIVHEKKKGLILGTQGSKLGFLI